MIEKKLAINTGMPQRFAEIRGDTSVVEFCRLLGMSVTKWWLYEMGKGLPEFEELMGICLITKTSPSWLLFGSREDFPFTWRRSRRRQAVKRPNHIVQISLAAQKRIALENICKFLRSQYQETSYPLFFSGNELTRKILKDNPMKTTKRVSENNGARVKRRTLGWPKDVEILTET